MISKQAIIWGGGFSIKKGLEIGLQSRLQGKFVINCNYSFLHFPGTFLTFMDRDFYVPYHKKEDKRNPDIYDKLKELPLLIGLDRNIGLKEFLLPNTILLKPSDTFNNDPLNKGFYHRVLTGIFSLSLASFLLDYEGEIFLLGFDFSQNSKEPTHYYEDQFTHSGTRHTSIFHKPTDRFNPFTKEKGLHIYNVSPNSYINTFEKIDYLTFFNLLNTEFFNQTALREGIKSKLLDYKL